jgi:uncharacterized protein YggL (DUF469 family)
MAWDIYGNVLRRGFCEVHPNVNQEYPCYICMEESRKCEDDRRRQYEYEKEMKKQYEESLKPDRIFNITENGFCMDGSGKVSVPACKIKAKTFLEASEKLTRFLTIKELTPDIELITPLEKISFE